MIANPALKLNARLINCRIAHTFFSSPSCDFQPQGYAASGRRRNQILLPVTRAGSDPVLNPHAACRHDRLVTTDLVFNATSISSLPPSRQRVQPHAPAGPFNETFFHSSELKAERSQSFFESLAPLSFSLLEWYMIIIMITATLPSSLPSP
eukprot:757370-Hanusia_phi.AAC.1